MCFSILLLLASCKHQLPQNGMETIICRAPDGQVYLCEYYLTMRAVFYSYTYYPFHSSLYRFLDQVSQYTCVDKEADFVRHRRGHRLYGYVHSTATSRTLTESGSSLSDKLNDWFRHCSVYQR